MLCHKLDVVNLFIGPRAQIHRRRSRLLRPHLRRRSRGTRQAWTVSEEIEIEPHCEDDSNRKQNRADQRIVHGLAPLEKQEFLDDAAVNFDIYSIAAFETERSPAKAGPSMASSTVAE